MCKCVAGKDVRTRNCGLVALSEKTDMLYRCVMAERAGQVVFSFFFLLLSRSDSESWKKIARHWKRK